MEKIICDYCKKIIISKDNLLLGSHLIKKPSRYHLECYDIAKEELDILDLKRPIIKIHPKKINWIITSNISNILLGIFFIFINTLIQSKELIILKVYLIMCGILLILIGTVYTYTFIKLKKIIPK